MSVKYDTYTYLASANFAHKTLNQTQKLILLPSPFELHELQWIFAEDLLIFSNQRSLEKPWLHSFIEIETTADRQSYSPGCW